MATLNRIRGLASCLSLATAQLVWSASPVAAIEPASAAWPEQDRVTILIKFLPKPGESAAGRVEFVADSCRACTQLHDPAYERFNSRESILQLRVPRSRFLRLSFKAAEGDIERAVVNNQELDLARVAGGQISLELPPLDQDTIWAGAFATEIVETGVTLRMEHGDPERRAGAYAKGPFPSLERRAADNLTFGQREAIRRLKLGEYVERENIGQIMLMGFDTNFPAAHTDAPPHIHMHLRWANNIGTQISHFYIGRDGMLTENRVGIRGFGVPAQTLGRGKSFTTIDRFGRPVYTHIITADGALTIANSRGDQCFLTPANTGFHQGVDLKCGQQESTRIEVLDDITEGTITVKTGILTEYIRYDRQIGHLMNPSGPLSSPASTLNPD